MSQALPYNESKFDRNPKLEDILNAVMIQILVISLKLT